MDINRVILVGRLTKDAVVEKTEKGTPYASFCVATNLARKTDAGKWEDDPQFIYTSIFGKHAESLTPYLKKGQPVAIEGHLKSDQYVYGDGQSMTRIYLATEQIQLLARSGKTGKAKTDAETPQTENGADEEAG